MRVIFETDEQTKSRVRKLADFFETLSLNSSARGDAENVVRRGLDENFRNEGTPGSSWTPLVKWTQRVRARQGYHPQHPILQRTGGLRESFAPGGALGFSRYETRGSKRGVALLQIGSSHPLAALLEGGNPSSNLPARPITSEIPQNHMSELGDVLDEFFHSMEGNM